MQTYQVTEGNTLEVGSTTHQEGALVELESAAEETIAAVEAGIIKVREEMAESQTEEEPVAPVEPAPVVPTEPVAPTAVQTATAALQAKYPTPPAPFESMAPMLYAFCKAIEAHEVCAAPGTDPKYPQGTRSYFDKNPGNLKYRNQSNSVGEDKDGFAIFDTIDDGFLALAHQVTIAANGQSKSYINPLWDANVKAWRQMNFQDFFKIYDSSYGDNPTAYAADVAAALEVPVTTSINQII